MTALDAEFNAELTEIFREEATTRLDQMGKALLAMEAGHADAETIDALFRNAHTIKGSAGMLGFEDVRSLGHAVEDILASVREEGVFPPELAEPLMRATAGLRAQITGTAEPIAGLLDDLAASVAAYRGGDIGAPGASLPGPGGPEVTVAEASGPGPIVPAPTVPRPSVPGPSVPERRTLRVPAEKIDHLLDVVGEVVQSRRRLAHSLAEEGPLSLEIAEVLGIGDRMLGELKDIAVGMRTLLLSVITGPFPRAVRDFACAERKSVDFVVTGPDTELDRVILESLSEPLGHLLRNAVNHGIESSEERVRAGKPPRGRIEVRAVPRGNLVEIVVADDGRGVSPEVVEEARREGSLADVLARAGYSTAEQVTDLAGRGVGLDAVKTYAQSLGGSLEVRSEPGQGMEIILLLPLALALLDVLLFERGGAVYGVPLAAVEEVLTLTATSTLEGRPSLEVRGRPLPVTDFAALVGASAPPLGGRPPALLIAAGARRAVAPCDARRGEEEVVVKPLGPLFGSVGGYLGAAILGDGRIALLVEPAMLTRGRQRVRGTVPIEVGPAGLPKVLVVEGSLAVRWFQGSILV